MKKQMDGQKGRTVKSCGDEMFRIGVKWTWKWKGNIKMDNFFNQL